MLGQLRTPTQGARAWSIVVSVAVGLGAVGAASAPAASPGAARVRVGAAPPIASSARDIGGVAASTRMHVTVILRLRDAAGLAAYARAVSTPGSSRYHAYLTPGQVARRFAATPSRVRAVEASMRRHGLTVGKITPNRLSVPLTGTAAQIEQAFSLSFRRRALRGGRVAVVANAAPAFDAKVAGDVQGVVGLSSLSAPKPLLVRPASRQHASDITRGPAPRSVPGAASACPTAQAAASSQGAYTADQIASAYRFTDLYGQGAEGQGQTVAIYELEPYDPNDVSAYQSCYGLSASVSNVAVDGGAGSGAGSGEAALDIENAVGLAPKANFLVYQGPNSNQDTPGSGPYDTFNTIISQDKARVVSVSWGECEQLQGSSNIAGENTLFEEAAAQGQSIVSATGDNGSEDCNGSNGGLPDPQLAVDDPGSQPFITGVGGTSMPAPGPPPNEAVWNHGGNLVRLLLLQGGAGGGGVSRAWAMPGYQRDAAASVHVIGPDSGGSNCASPGGYCRQVPDVSADADPATGYIVYWNGGGADPASPRGWQAVGGTSAAAPVWAALLADADSSSACQGSAIGFANPALYTAAGDGYSNHFNDITTGNNDYTGSNGGLYPAGTGYDMASGLGTPNAGALSAVLCADALRVNNPGTQFATVGQSVKLQVTTSALPGAKLTFYSSHLPPGLTISKSSGRITGKPKRTGSWRVGVAASDQHLSLRATYFTWKVGGAPKLSRTSLSGVGRGRPTLRFRLNAGRSAPQLKTISLGASRGFSFGKPSHAVSVTGQKGRRVAFTARLLHGRLQITLAHPTSGIRLTIRYAALRASGSVAAEVRGHRRLTLNLSVNTVDAAGHRVSQRAHIRASG